MILSQILKFITSAMTLFPNDGTFTGSGDSDRDLSFGHATISPITAGLCPCNQKNPHSYVPRVSHGSVRLPLFWSWTLNNTLKANSKAFEECDPSRSLSVCFLLVNLGPSLCLQGG